MRALVCLMLGVTCPLLLVAQAPEATPVTESSAAVEAEAITEASPTPPSDGNQTLPSWRGMDPPGKPDAFRISRQGRPWQREARQRLREHRERHRTAAAPHRAGVTVVRRRARSGLMIPERARAPVVADGTPPDAATPAAQPAAN